MIPKIIHYCWFGDEAIPDNYQEYINSWKKINPDYEIMLWNESNSPMNLKYLQNAKKNKKWANMSNLVRFHALYIYGGIYLDTDIKLIKPLDTLLKNECFLGFEQDDSNANDIIVNNAVLGAKKKHQFISQCLKHISSTYDGTENADLSAPVMVTSILKDNYGLSNSGYQILNSSITIYPSDFFYPIHVHKSFQLENWKDHITENTICIHMWGRSWLTIEEAKKSIDWLNKSLLEKEATLKESIEQIDSLKNTAEEIWQAKVYFESLHNAQNNEVNRLKDLINQNTNNYFSEITNIQKQHNDQLSESIKELLSQELRHLKNENGIYFRRKILKEELDQKKQELAFLKSEAESLKLSFEEKLFENNTLQQNNLSSELSFKQHEEKLTIKIQTLEGSQQKQIQENDLLRNETIEKQAIINSLSDKLEKEIAEKQAIINSLSDKLEKEIAEKQAIVNSLSDKLEKGIAEKQAIVNSLSDKLEKEIAEKQVIVNSLSDKLEKEIAEKQVIVNSLSDKLEKEIAEKQTIIDSFSDKIKKQSSIIEQYEIQLSEFGFFDLFRKKLNQKND